MGPGGRGGGPGGRGGGPHGGPPGWGGPGPGFFGGFCDAIGSWYVKYIHNTLLFGFYESIFHP